MAAQQPVVLNGGIVKASPAAVPSRVPPKTWSIGGLFFDAWMVLSHQSSITATRHPVANGATITDHAFVNPLMFTFEIGMSDTVTSFSASTFRGNPTRVVEAYTALNKMLNERKPVEIATKYGYWENVLVSAIVANDDFTTSNAGFFTVSCQEILRADIRRVEVRTSIPQATNSTKRGEVSLPPLRSQLSILTGRQQ